VYYYILVLFLDSNIQYIDYYQANKYNLVERFLSTYSANHIGAGEKYLLFYSYAGEIYYYEGDKTLKVP